MRRLLKKDLGVLALVEGTNENYGLPALRAQATLDLMDCHAYWQHPSFPTAGRTTTSASRTPRWSTSRRVARSAGCAGRRPQEALRGQRVQPPVPSEYGCEAPLLLAAFASLQDWDALFLYTLCHRWTRRPSGGTRSPDSSTWGASRRRWPGASGRCPLHPGRRAAGPADRDGRVLSRPSPRELPEGPVWGGGFHLDGDLSPLLPLVHGFRIARFDAERTTRSRTSVSCRQRNRSRATRASCAGEEARERALHHRLSSDRRGGGMDRRAEGRDRVVALRSLGRPSRRRARPALMASPWRVGAHPPRRRRPLGEHRPGVECGADLSRELGSSAGAHRAVEGKVVVLRRAAPEVASPRSSTLAPRRPRPADREPQRIEVQGGALVAVLRADPQPSGIHCRRSSSAGSAGSGDRRLKTGEVDGLGDMVGEARRPGERVELLEEMLSSGGSLLVAAQKGSSLLSNRSPRL